MKITPDTKIKYLIPEGWEIDNDNSSSISDQYIVIPLRMLPKKDFMGYAKDYYNRHLNRLTSTHMESFIECLYSENYEGIPFVFRIGLIKFICEDLKLTLDDMYHYLRVYYVDDMPSKFDTIYSIVPSEFMDSLTD
jgi:hypothetical protein